MFKKILLIFFLIMNIYTFISVKIDKDRAINGEYRTAEVKLVALSSLGAAPGTLIGFKVFNHKTNKNKKGYLWDALNIVLVQNLLLYVVVISRKSNSKEKQKILAYERRDIRRY